MKQLFKKLISKSGWEVRRSSSQVGNNMLNGLIWLRRNGFKFNTIIDVGASDGRWTKQCRNVFSKSRYILFEPQPTHSDKLDNYVSLTGNSVTVIKKAVGGHEGVVNFDAEDPLGGVITSVKNQFTIQVPVTTIDAVIGGMYDQPPYLLKLDTHGIEKSILDGSEITLKNCHALIVEAYNYRIIEDALLFWELCDFLARKGFRPIHLVDVSSRPFDDTLWQMDIFFIRSDWKGYEHVSYT
jgi:FkbM family methyltransferase